MPKKKVKFFVPDWMATAATENRHGFLNAFIDVLVGSGFDPQFAPDIGAGLFQPDLGDGYGVFYMAPANHPRGLTFRKNYFFPFWQIEHSAKRWEWPVAAAAFDPDQVDGAKARRFVAQHRKRLFPEHAPSEKQHILVALQGKLLMKRSFQPCSPIEMISDLAERVASPMVLSLHPNEFYNEQELNILTALVAEYPQISVEKGGALNKITQARAIVTMNSGAAVTGYFFGKPSAVLAQSDFPHIATNWSDDWVAQLLAGLDSPPDFDKYLYWFLQQQSINAGRDDLRDQIHARLVRLGWPV